jgi:hypothetical protein
MLILKPMKGSKRLQREGKWQFVKIMFWIHFRTWGHNFLQLF